MSTTSQREKPARLTGTGGEPCLQCPQLRKTGERRRSRMKNRRFSRCSALRGTSKSLNGGFVKITRRSVRKRSGHPHQVNRWNRWEYKSNASGVLKPAETLLREWKVELPCRRDLFPLQGDIQSGLVGASRLPLPGLEMARKARKHPRRGGSSSFSRQLKEGRYVARKRI